MKIGSPSNIEVLLHFHTTPERHPRENAPAVVSAIRGFIQRGCLVPDDEAQEVGRYRTTDKGKAWVKALCNVEEPRVVYFDQYGNNLNEQL
jgi:hypothetical protein